MLCPYRFATLVLIKNASDQIDPDHAGLDTLPKRHRLALKGRTTRVPRACVALDSHSILEKIGSRTG